MRPSVGADHGVLESVRPSVGADSGVLESVRPSVGADLGVSRTIGPTLQMSGGRVNEADVRSGEWLGSGREFIGSKRARSERSTDGCQSDRDLLGERTRLHPLDRGPVRHASLSDREHLDLDGSPGGGNQFLVDELDNELPDVEITVERPIARDANADVFHLRFPLVGDGVAQDEVERRVRWVNQRIRHTKSDRVLGLLNQDDMPQLHLLQLAYRRCLFQVGARFGSLNDLPNVPCERRPRQRRGRPLRGMVGRYQGLSEQCFHQYVSIASTPSPIVSGPAIESHHR